MARRSGLGKGLGALIPASEVDTEPSQAVGAFRDVPISSIKANSYQPRKHLDESELEPLSLSIKEVGVLQPLLVRDSGSGSYELIAGERRWRAAKKAGLKVVPVIVRESEDLQSLEEALVENLHRQDLNPLDEAAAYQQLIDDFSLTHELVGKRMGKSRTAVSNLLRILQLPPKVQKLLGEGKLSEGHGRALLGSSDEAFQVQLAERAAKDQLSVRAVEEAIRMRNELSEPETKVRRSAPRTANAPALEWQERLIDELATRVAITVGAKRGRIVIDFADMHDLERIAERIAAGSEAQA